MPTTTTGVATEFINFTRASNATVTDSNGLIDWAAHNLLLASEQFDASQWSKYGSGSIAPTVTANAAVSPNGTTTADEVSLPAVVNAGDVSVLIQSITTPIDAYSGGVWVKAKAAGDVGKQIVVYCYDTAFVAKTHATLTADWQLVSVSGTSTGTFQQFNIGVIGTTSGGVVQGAVSVYVWGAHWRRNSLGGMQANTSAYPMYNPTTPKNLLGSTEDFSAAAWSPTTLSVLANTAIAPNGLTTADKIYPTANDGSMAVTATSTIALKTFSVYAKAAEFGVLCFREPGNAANGLAYVNLSTGAVTNSIPATATVTATSAGDGWWRIGVSYASVAAGSVVRFGPSNAAGAVSSTASGTNGILVWGAQLSDSASLDPYVANHFAAPSAAAYYGPRRDFDSAGVCRGLLVEEQRANLALQSAAFDVGWTTINLLAFGSGSVANAIASPDGTVTADLIVPDTTSGQHGVFRTVTTVSGTAYTSSVYAKAGGYNWLYMTEANNVTAQASFNISTGVLGTVSGTGSPSATITAVGNGWYRCTLTFTPISTSSNIQLRANSADGGFAFTGNGTSGIYLYGAQLEAGSFATSYIPTTTATATRSADVAQVSTAAFPYSQTEGTLVVSVTKDFLGGDAVSAALYTTGVSDTMELFFNSSDSRLYAATGGVTQVNLIDTGKVVAGATTKAGFAYAANNYALSTNGGAAVPDTTATVPPVAALGIGSRAGGLPFRGWIRQITYLPRRISNAELQSRTA